MKEGVYMENISIKDLRGKFADYCNDLLTYNKALNEEFSIDGTVTEEVKRYGKTMYFTIVDDEKSSVKVKVDEENFEKIPLLVPGNRVNVKGRISLNRQGYIKGFELMQLNAAEVERLGNMTADYSSALMYVSMSKKVKKSIDYAGKSYMTVAVITSRDGEGLPDVQYTLRGCEYFKLKHIPTNMFDPEEIATNINNAKEDIVMVVRGGTTNVDIFNDIRILKAIVCSKSFTICGIGHAQQEPLINQVVDIEQSTPTSAGMYLRNNYNAFIKNLESEKQKIEISKKDKGKTRFIVVLILIIAVLLLKYKFKLF